MDFHQLPRRDLQALCKRNGIRANMTNGAMADALAALSAVDGIEEEDEKKAAAAAEEEEEEQGQGEMQGISLPGGRGVALTPHEVILLDGSEEEDEDLMPALAASRRARVDPVAAPATRESPAPAEAVPARTTRARSQRMVVSPSAPEEEAPKARRSSRRAVATKTSTEQEEEEKGMQGDASDGCVVDLPVQADVQQGEDSSNFRNDAVSSEEIHHASEDTEMVPVISGEASGAAEENDEVPTSGGMLESPAKAIEDKEPVAAPVTRKRAAASMAKTAAESVLARVTRARSQRTVVSAPVEEAPEARRTSKRAVARKTSTGQEEEEKGTQGDVSDECLVDSSAQELQSNVQQCQDLPNFRNDAVSSGEIHHASEDTEMVPVISGEASGAAEENDEVPTSGGMLESPAKAIEDKEPVAAPVTRKRAAASMAKTAVESVPARVTRARSQRTVVLAPVEEALEARRTSRRAVARKTSTGQEEEEKGTQGDVSDECLVDSSVQELQSNVQQCEDLPNFRNDAVSSEEIHHASEDTAAVPVVKSGEAAEEVDFTSGVAGENEVLTSGGMLQSAARAIEEKEPVTARTTRKRAASSMAKTAAEAAPARITRARSHRAAVLAPDEEAPKARRSSRRAGARKTSTEQEEEEKGTQGDVSDENEVPTSVEMLQSAAKAIEEKEDMAVVEEETVVATNEMTQRTATVEDGVIEVVTVENLSQATVENLSQATVTDDEWVVKESAFASDLIDVSIEEEAAVVADEMPLSFQEELVPVDILSQATVTDDEGAVKESGFSCDLTDLSVEEKGVVAADGMPQSLVKLDERVEQPVTVDNLSQATLTDDEGAVKESGFSCHLTDLSVEENGVVAADEMSQRSATLDESAREEVATVENLSQATVTDDEWVVKESAFTGDLPPVADTARDFSDLAATKSMSMDSTLEPMVSQGGDVSLRVYSNSGGQNGVVSQADDVPLRVYSNIGGQKNGSEHVAVEREKDVKEGKDCAALGSLSLRKLRIKLKEKLAVAQDNEAGDVQPCSSGGEKSGSKPVAVKREGEMKEGNESEALGSLSLRKLRTKLKEKVTAAQENGVKEGKGSKTLDKLSLRKLKMKLKETLNAQKVISE